MKKRIRLILVILSLALLTACSSKPETQDSSVASPSAPAADSSTAALSDQQKPKQTADDQTTVTVSSIQELAEAIDSDTHIILKAGEYNFSELTCLKSVENPHIQSDYFDILTYSIYSVQNLTIEPEDGAEVSIVTENPYGVPLEFRYCSDIRLNGLTCGHKTNPGTCMGSVLRFDRCYNIEIDKCRLFGCGAYGLEVSESEIISMTNSEIYECSDGILNLYDAYNIQFTLCKFHDNNSGTMFWISDCWDVRFTDTEILDNNNIDEFAPFLYGDTDTLYFSGCTFRGNSNEPDPSALAETYTADFQNCRIFSDN